MVVKIIRIICENCGKSKCKSASEVRKRKHHFCSKDCYWEYRKRKKTPTTKGLKYDYSQLEGLKELAKKNTKNEFKPVGYW